MPARLLRSCRSCDKEGEPFYFFVIVRTADLLTPLRVSVIVAVVFRVTLAVVMVKVTLAAPAGTVTLAGTAAEALLSLNATTAPPDPAGAFRVTVPVELFPPLTLEGERLSPEGVMGLIVKLACRVTPLYEA